MPYHDAGALDLSAKVITKLKPDVVIFGGDQIDSYGVSRFSKNPLDPNSQNFQAELDKFQIIFDKFLKAAGDAEKVMLIGNHELRLSKFLRDRAPALYGLKSLQLSNLLDLEKLNVSLVSAVTIGGGLFTHGEQVRKASGASAMAHLEAISFAQSIVIGHCHRLGLVWKSRPRQAPVFGMESGHASNPKKLDYLGGDFINWQTGMALITYVDGVAYPQPLPFHRHGRGWAAVLDGRLIF